MDRSRLEDKHLIIPLKAVPHKTHPTPKTNKLSHPHKMPVAISRNNNATLTENGFITRNYPPVGEEEFSEEEFDEESEGEENDHEDEDEDDYSDDNEEERESLLPSTSARSSELFDEYFEHEPSVINRQHTCNHQATSRPCAYCTPSVSMRLANEVRIAHKILFSPKVIKFDYVPLDKSILEGPFKSLKALHDIGYIKKVLAEIINLIVAIQNVPNYKMNYIFSSALLRIHDRMESLLDDIRGSGKFAEYQVVYDFRKKLNAIGMTCGNNKENYTLHCSMLIDCQR